jgi:peptidoglycan/xylan/chitin deacetylase (PgdA/CDA1 family)
VIPETVERRARWVLEALGAADVDWEYDAHAWEQVDRGEVPQDELAAAFFHLARIEERDGARDEHGRFRASSSCLDPLDPPLERLRRTLGAAPAAPFAVALTHDVDSVRRWTRRGVRGALARVKSGDFHDVPGLARLPVHIVRRTDPNWAWERIVAGERERDATSTFFVLGANRHRLDAQAPQLYDRLRPRLLETLRALGAEIGVHGSYLAADDAALLAEEAETLGSPQGQRYHFLRVDPHRNLAPLPSLGFSYDSSLGFADALGFRAGIARPFRPWNVDLVEIPLAVMDATLDRYLRLTPHEAERRVAALLDRAADGGWSFALLWHPDRYEGAWGRLYWRILDGVRARGGALCSCAQLVSSHSTWSK